MTNKLKSPQTALYFLALVLALLPWALMQTDIRIPADAAWLVHAARHALNGESITQSYFDHNPPLCFLIYAPVVWMSDLLGWSVITSLNLYTGGLTLLALAYSVYILCGWKITARQLYLTLSAYLVAASVFMTLEYAQKDHLIAIGILPFLLTQLSITQGHKISKPVLYGGLMFFALFVLIKPHYGLLPAVIFLHRLYRRKSLSVVLDADFVILSMMTTAYIALIYFAFPEYIHTVLPAGADLYAFTVSFHFSLASALGTAFFSLCLLTLALCHSPAYSPATPQNGAQDAGTPPMPAPAGAGEGKALAAWLCALACLAVIPYAVQGKGFTLHLLPYIVLLSAAAGSVAALYFTPKPQGENAAATSAQKDNPGWETAFVLPLILFVALLIAPSPDKKHHHAYYQSHPVLEVLHAKDASAAPRYYYIESASTNVALQIPHYSNLHYGSRFSLDWFTLGLQLRKAHNKDTTAYAEMFVSMLVEDIERFKPETMLFIDEPEQMTILNSYGENPLLQAALADYREDGVYTDTDIKTAYIPLNQDIPIRFKVFRRKDGL